jgi:hypothetical protein
MPINPALRHLYAADWRSLSGDIRFGRAGGRCEACGRPHRRLVYALQDGRWLDPDGLAWRDGAGGEPADEPTLSEAAAMRLVRVVISTAHLDQDPANREPDNLRALCQRRHLSHDLDYHLARRWITCRRRHAGGDLFLDAYSADAPRMG